jgi:hypothetical protein
MKHKYKNINAKLRKLKNEQLNNADTITNKFYKRVENVSNITFTDEEIQLRSKGLKYNLHYKQRDWTQTLAIEDETPINQLNPNEQAYMRQIVINKLQTLITNERTQKDRQIPYKIK